MMTGKYILQIKRTKSFIREPKKKKKITRAGGKIYPKRNRKKKKKKTKEQIRKKYQVSRPCQSWHI